ncbi:MAG: hypothetical protein ABIQ95_05845 [Bdellovibrionia bacterium]
MRLQHYGLIGNLLLVICSSPLRAETTSFVGGYVIDNGYASPLTGFTIQASTPQFGGGLLMDFDLDKGGGPQIELGILYMPRGFIEVLDNRSTITISQTTLQAPLLFRFPIFPNFSLGIGAFLSYALTSTSNLNVLDSGIVGSAAMKFGFQKSVSMLVDIRYQFGLTNLSTVSGFGTYFYDLQGLVGIVLGF